MQLNVVFFVKRKNFYFALFGI